MATSLNFVPASNSGPTRESQIRSLTHHTGPHPHIPRAAFICPQPSLHQDTRSHVPATPGCRVPANTGTLVNVSSEYMASTCSRWVVAVFCHRGPSETWPALPVTRMSPGPTPRHSLSALTGSMSTGSDVLSAAALDLHPPPGPGLASGPMCSSSSVGTFPLMPFVALCSLCVLCEGCFAVRSRMWTEVVQARDGGRGLRCHRITSTRAHVAGSPVNGCFCPVLILCPESLALVQRQPSLWLGSAGATGCRSVWRRPHQVGDLRHRCLGARSSRPPAVRACQRQTPSSRRYPDSHLHSLPSCAG